MGLGILKVQGYLDIVCDGSFEVGGIVVRIQDQQSLVGRGWVLLILFFA